MKTIFHANVDGNKVVTGFGEAAGLIDPVATEIKIAPLLAAASEMQQLKALNAQMNAARQTRQSRRSPSAEQARLGVTARRWSGRTPNIRRRWRWSPTSRSSSRRS